MNPRPCFLYSKCTTASLRPGTTLSESTSHKATETVQEGTELLIATSSTPKLLLLQQQNHLVYNYIYYATWKTSWCTTKELLFDESLEMLTRAQTGIQSQPRN